MGTTVKRVEEALKREGLRHCVDAIERNPATPGEVVMWSGVGHPVYSVKGAIKEARKLCASQEEPITRDKWAAYHDLYGK